MADRTQDESNHNQQQNIWDTSPGEETYKKVGAEDQCSDEGDH
jgi:hypothetical protein